MPRTRSIAWAELKIGIFVVVGLGLVTALVLTVGGQSGFWWQHYPLKARFADVRGLKTGAVVRLSGTDVGSVTDVSLTGAEVEVRMNVLKSVRPVVTTESTADIGSVSLLGEPIINIVAGHGGRPLGNDEYLKSASSGGAIDQLTSSASASLSQLDQLLAGVRAGQGTLGKLITDDEIYNEMKTFVTSAATLTQALNAGRGTLGALMKDPAAYDALKGSLQNLQTMTDRINNGQGALGRLVNDDALGKSLSGAVTNLDQVSDKLSKGQGTAGKLLTDDQLYTRLNDMAGHLDALTASIDAGRGTAGALVRDQQLYENMNRAVTALQGLIGDIRKDPQKFLHVRVSIF